MSNKWINRPLENSLIRSMINYDLQGGWLDAKTILRRGYFKSQATNLSNYMNPLIKRGIVESRWHHYIDNRNRHHERKQFRLKSNVFAKLFLIFSDDVLDNDIYEFMSSVYFQENRYKEDLFVDFCNLLNKRFPLIGGKKLAVLDSTHVVMMLPSLFVFYLENQSTLIEILDAVYQVLSDELPSNACITPFFLSCIIFNQIITHRKNVSYRGLLEKGLREYLERLEVHYRTKFLFNQYKRKHREKGNK